MQNNINIINSLNRFVGVSIGFLEGYPKDSSLNEGPFCRPFYKDAALFKSWDLNGTWLNHTQFLYVTMRNPIFENFEGPYTTQGLVC